MIYLLLVILIEISFISYMIWDNVQWQQKVQRFYNVPTPKKEKIKLKKGQKIVFAVDDEINPFEGAV